MVNRLSRALAKVLSQLSAAKSNDDTAGRPDLDALRDIDFQPLEPTSSVGVDGKRLLCPVTRQELAPGAPIFQCQACRIAYSEAGWRFLRRVDRGRCCGCGLRKTVLPLPRNCAVPPKSPDTAE